MFCERSDFNSRNSNKKLSTLLLSLSVTLRQILYGIPVFVWMAQFQPVYPDVSGHGSLITIHRILAG